MNAYVSLSPDQTKVVTEYANPQNPPTPPGYAVLADNDPRVVAFRQMHPQ